MRQWLRRHLTYANVMVTILAFIVLTGGTAVALSGTNTVDSGDIINDEVKSIDVRNDTLPTGGLAAADLRPGSVGSSEAAANSLNGGDINESSLGQVPSALLGGFGRSTGEGSCDPENPPASYLGCDVITGFNVPQESRFLLIGYARAFLDAGATFGLGNCRLDTPSGPIVGNDVNAQVSSSGEGSENLAIVGITDSSGAGTYSFAMACRETSGGIRYDEAGITALAISPD